MRITKLVMLIALSAVLLMSLPAYADASFTTYSQPGGLYVNLTTNYGGGDGSGGTLFSLGPFNFSSGMLEFSVPGSWATWNCPPATESCTPNVLYSNGATSLTLMLPFPMNVAGFELEPDQFAVETFTATYYAADLTTVLGTITLDVNGSAGALLFAASDSSDFGKIVIINTAGDDFAIAQLRAGNLVCCGTPEPGTIVLFGSGMLGIFAAVFRKLNL